jgi:RNA polymerase sigma factor (sigma-70 family)
MGQVHVEASAIPASVGLTRTRLAIGGPLLRIRSDEQLVSLFRSGSEEAFRAIHDRYRQRMFAYTRQMLAGSSSDAEDAVQEIFVRAYAGLRASDRKLALRAWLYRIAHNRCIDELRRPQLPASDVVPASVAGTGSDPVARLEQRDALRRLIADVQRLPEQQRSALLMRELGGMTYSDVSEALGVSVPAVKSLLVRARVGLAQANEARDTACARIREDLIVSHDRGVRASGLARRHLRDCPHCRQFRSEVRGVSRQLAALVPVGPLGVIAKVLGIGGAGGGSAAAGTSAIAGGGATATGLAGTGAAASAGAIAGAGHVVTILATAVVTAGGAIELQHIAPPAAHAAHYHRIVAHVPRRATSSASVASSADAEADPATPAASSASGASTQSTSSSAAGGSQSSTQTGAGRHVKAATSQSTSLPLTEQVDPDNLIYLIRGETGRAGTLGAGATKPAAASSSTAGATSTSSPSGTSSSASPTPASGTTAASGTASSTGVAGSSAPASTTTGPASATSTASSGTPAATTGTSGTSGTSVSANTSSPAGTTGTSAGGATETTSATTIAPAASKGSTTPTPPVKTTKASKHSGAVAVFTMTGN